MDTEIHSIVATKKNTIIQIIFIPVSFEEKAKKFHKRQLKNPSQHFEELKKLYTFDFLKKLYTFGFLKKLSTFDISLIAQTFM